MFRATVQINKFIFIFLLIIVLAGLAYFIYERNLFYKIRNSLQQALTESKEERSRLSQENEQLNTEKGKLTLELGDLKVQLAQIQESLTQAQQEKKILQEENSRLNEEVTNLKEKAVNLNEEIANLKEDIRLWEGKIVNLDEVELVKEKRAKSWHELKQRIRDQKIKAQQEIVRMHQEMNKIQSKLGNHGYIIKDGKPTYLVTEKSIDLDKIIIRRPTKE